MIINACEYGIIPDKNITKEISRLFTGLCDVTVKFQPGDYYVSSSKADIHRLVMSNSTGDKEYNEQEIPHNSPVFLYLNGCKNLKIEAQDAHFHIDGKMTNIALADCENVEIFGMKISHINPDMHEWKVINVSEKTVDFKFDENTLCKIINGELYFYGENYCEKADIHKERAFWTAFIKHDNKNRVERLHHPMKEAEKYDYLGENILRVYYEKTEDFDIGDRYYTFDVRRSNAGVFISRSKDIKLSSFTQHFNYALAVVCQDSENITIENSKFIPDPEKDFLMSSGADFLQFSMCRGKIAVTGCEFIGAGDDTVNVHGNYYMISDIKNNTLTLNYCHPQTHGFNPLRVGDKVKFVGRNSLVDVGEAEILKSEMLNEYTILVTVDSVKNAKIEDVLEDISACPDFKFTDNKTDRIITRGILFTTRGKVVISNNHFGNCSHHGIFINGDAHGWYESGKVENALIENNEFLYCGMNGVCIFPEVKEYKGDVHENIIFRNNVFKKTEFETYSITHAKNITVDGKVIF